MRVIHVLWILILFLSHTLLANTLLTLDHAVVNSTYTWDESTQKFSLNLEDQSTLIFARDVQTVYSPTFQTQYKLESKLQWNEGRISIESNSLEEILKQHSKHSKQKYTLLKNPIETSLIENSREVFNDRTSYRFLFNSKVEIQFDHSGNFHTLTFTQPFRLDKDFSTRYKVGQVRSMNLIKSNLKPQIKWEVNHLVGQTEAVYSKDSTEILVHFYRPGKSPTELNNSNKSKSKKIKTIIVDAGHGGKDVGAVGKISNEKTITLKTAKILEKELTKAGYTVKLTRDTDKFLTLAERPKLAKKWNGDLFLSLHCNAIDGSQDKKNRTKGFKIFILREASDEDDKELAKRENKFIHDNHTTSKTISIVEWIKLEHQLNLYTKQSEEFASHIVRQFEIDKSKIRKHGSGAGQAGFYVLVGTFMPAVLVEMGFISNPDDEKYMNSAKGQLAIAKRITQAIIDYDKSIQTH